MMHEMCVPQREMCFPHLGSYHPVRGTLNPFAQDPNIFIELMRWFFPYEIVLACTYVLIVAISSHSVRSERMYGQGNNDGKLRCARLR